ncbi:MAG: hypothetical protein JST82_12445 [Bacteroidetes bacterium]|nr:hypothetical protein [Bacteroidota bacterium]
MPLKSITTYKPIATASVLLCVIVVYIYPHLQYYIDPDATAYLTISKRYANGDYVKAVNGYWSPWSCWLTAIGIRLGLEVMQAAIIANTIGALGVLTVTLSFFKKYRVADFAQWVLLTALAIFLSYAVYYQNFDDLWECFFLLYVLRIMISHRFKHTPYLWVVAGVVGALAYFAKAYAFVFFIVSTIILVFYITRAWNKKHLMQWLKICGVMIGIMLLLSFPWICMLHDKYGIWMTSTAGRLNMSWYLVGHPIWKNDIQYLLPPVYPDSPTYWEDPWYVNGATPHFWDSWNLLVRQLMKLVQNSWKFLVSSMQISVAFLLVSGYIARLLFRKMRRQKYKVYYPVIIAFLLFPLPFFLINFEPRYIWYMLPLSMLLGVAIMQRNKFFNKRWLLLVFAFSYIIYPIKGIAEMWDEGKMEYELAKELREADVHGRFACKAAYGMNEYVAVQRLIYFSGDNLYLLRSDMLSIQKSNPFPELRRYGVNYIFWYHQIEEKGWHTYVMQDEPGKPLPVVFQKRGLVVWALTPH